MSFLKNYLKPAAAKREEKRLAAASANPAMMDPADTPVTTRAANTRVTSGANTPFDRSRHGSRPASIYPTGDFRNAALDDIQDIKCDVMVNWLHQQQIKSMWTKCGMGEGVVLKKSRGNFTACPPELAEESDGLYLAVSGLNVRVAMTVNTRVISLFLQRTSVPYVPLKNGLRIQILPSVADLPNCQKHHFAAFIEDSCLLVVWDDDPRFVLDRARDIQEQLMAMIWDVSNGEYGDEKKASRSHISAAEVGADGSSSTDAAEDLREKPRRLNLEQAVLCGITLALLVAALGSGWRQIAIEVAFDKSYMRVVLAAVVPAQAWLALFFMQALVGNISGIIGPIGQVKENSKFYSGVRPVRLARRHLPHVTVQCPVYKEGLRGVIEPTIKSVKTAISTYEMQGGTANIFVNDDGMQIIPEHEAQARRDFYDEHNIGWVARPKHNPKPEDGEKAFVRAGKFKKASNMNYALSVSCRVEDRLVSVHRFAGWAHEDEMAAYNDSLAGVIEEDEGRTWAEGNVRIGDYILIIDSDTRVPTDCFLDAVSEMEISPQVGIIQFSSGVMNVTTSFFENGITFFTNLIYTAIEYAVASGDVAPFVGHNAIMRWAAVQDVSYTREDGSDMYWSESTVSEDFDMALRLQTAGYIVRFSSYFGGDFKEGVSLTVYDELARWEKYAYGCNELLFHPLKYWFVRGPFTPLFRRFIGSRMPLPSKITIMAYIGTYYAIGSAWILTVMNYFVVGWFNSTLDKYYLDSFKIFFGIIVVFTALGNVALAILRYRLGERGLFAALVENFKWVLMLFIFMGGISIHVSQALLAHMCGFDMSWGATSKEAEEVAFFDEVPRVLRRFKYTFAFVALMFLAIVLLAAAPFVPTFWHIDSFIAVFPISVTIACHFLLPIVLNPNLMLFTW